MFLARLSIRNPVMVTMVTIALVVFGIMAIRTIGVTLTGETSASAITITTEYPGSDAGTIEEDVIKEIEDEVGTISGIKHIQGTAVDNVGIITITLHDGIDEDIVSQEVRDKLDLVKGDLPEGAEEPVVEKVDFATMPIMMLVLKTPAGENRAEVTDFAESRIKNRIQSLPGVGSITMYGDSEREIRVLMDPRNILPYNVPAIQMIQAMKNAVTELPAGTLDILNGSQEIIVKADGEPETLRDLNNLSLFTFGGTPVKVRDIARIEDGLEETDSSAFMNMTPAISLEVRKQGDANEVQLAASVKAEVAKIRGTLPKGYDLQVVADNSDFIEVAVGSAKEDIMLGAILSMLIIFVFLMNKRAALVIGVSLPASIIGTFLFVKSMGFTLNFMTTLAISLSVGILTDDAIVVIENIFRHLEMGKSRVKAAIEGTQEVGLAVISGTLSLVAVFGPTVYLDGMVGDLFREFGITVVTAILISMIVAFTVTPLMSSAILKEESKDGFFFRQIERFLTWLENAYGGAVSIVLHNKLITLVVTVALFVGGMSLAGSLKSEFIPFIENGEFLVTIELENEASLEKSRQIYFEMVETIGKEEWSNFSFATIGGGNTQEKNVINARVVMVEKEQRTITQADAMDKVREMLAYLEKKYGAKISLMRTIGGEGAPVQFSIAGSDPATLQADAVRMLDFMKNDKGFTDVTSTFKGNKKQIRIKFNHDRMTALGVNAAESAAVIRYLLSGETIGDYTDEAGEVHDIKVWLDDPFQRLGELGQLALSGQGGRVVRLSDIADITWSSSQARIDRMDRSLSSGFTAGIAQGSDLGGQVQKLEAFAKKAMSPGNRVIFSGDAEEMKSSFASLMTAFVVAVFLIYIVLASQFNSFVHPLTIMSALPFALTGAFVTLWFLDMAVSLFTFIGIILLMGIVTKNAILLVDFTIQRIGQGAEVFDALIEASKTRLRPILMTAMGTIFGMLPIVISTSKGAEIKHSMGWAVIGGLIFSSCVTLFIVPVIFTFFERMRGFFKRETPITTQVQEEGVV